MPSIMVYVTSKTYDYIYSQAKQENVTPAKMAGMLLKNAADEEVIAVDASFLPIAKDNLCSCDSILPYTAFVFIPPPLPELT